MLNDLRQACRLHARQPGFAIAASLTLALGIGANTAIFSVVDAALFRPLPYADPERLVYVITHMQLARGGTTPMDTSGNRVAAIRQIPGLFEDLGTFGRGGQDILSGGVGRPISVGGLTPDFPRFLGVAPLLGRVFDDRDIDAGDAVVISDEYWRREFGRDPEVIGRSIPFDKGSRVVVGVMPPTFRFFVGPAVDAWWPIPEADGDAIVGRLREGLTVRDASEAFQAAVSNANMTWASVGVELWAPSELRGTETATAMLFVLLGGVGALLLVACANVANLLLARTFVRQREIAVRSALGASRLALIRQVLAEGMTLAAAGGAAAVLIAPAGIRIIPLLVPADLRYTLLGVAPPTLDLRVLSAGLAVTLATGLLCAILPALRAASTSGGAALSASRRVAGATRAERRVSQVFQSLQVALTLVLLLGAGVMLAAFIRMSAMPDGYDARELAAVSLELPDASFPRVEDKRAFANEAMRQMLALPMVSGATIAYSPASGSGRGSGTFMPVGTETSGLPATPGSRFWVQPNYFQLMGIRILEGRAFAPDDAGANIAIIDSNAARRFWPGESAIGREFRLFATQDPARIVGVAAPIKTAAIAVGDVAVYYPLGQTNGTNLIVRLSGTPELAFPVLAETVRSIHPAARLRRIALLSDYFAEVDPLGPSRFFSILLGMLALVGLTTACVGLYALLSYSVNGRVQEIGVRMALGADAARVRRAVMAEALVPVAAGIVAGLLLSGWVLTFLATQLPVVRPDDSRTIVAVISLLLLVAALAAAGPVRRATRIDPATALRE